MKIVLVGCGEISKAWIGSVKVFKDVQIAGLVDIKKENAEKRKAEFKLDVPVFGNLEEAVKATGAEIVFDCTIPVAHHNTTISALKLGCHVLGEKPISDSMDNAREMVKTAAESGRTYAVIQNRRYDKNIIAFKKLFTNGVLGKLTTLNADFYLAPHFGGFREEMDHVLLIDMAIHSFDQARFISGSDPVRVYCHEFNPSGSWYKHGASAMAIFEMSNGVVFNYRGSWCSEGLNTSWQCDWRACCEKGSAKWDGEGNIIAERIADVPKGPNLKIMPEIGELKNFGHGGVIREFLDCVQKGGTPQTICTDNIKSLAMVYAAVESAETGKPVDIKF